MAEDLLARLARRKDFFSVTTTTTRCWSLRFHRSHLRPTYSGGANDALVVERPAEGRRAQKSIVTIPSSCWSGGLTTARTASRRLRLPRWIVMDSPCLASCLLRWWRLLPFPTCYVDDRLAALLMGECIDLVAHRRTLAFRGCISWCRASAATFVSAITLLKRSPSPQVLRLVRLEYFSSTIDAGVLNITF